MAADTPYTDAGAVLALCGELGIDLRADDVPDLDAHMTRATDYASARVDFYCARYAPADLAASQYVNDVAALLAVRWLCLHRLNEVPRSVEAEWGERQKELELVRVGKANVPRIAVSRRPGVVTNYHVDQRRFNNQVRVDPARSTGRASGYARPVDQSAPDQK